MAQQILNLKSQLKQEQTKNRSLGENELRLLAAGKKSVWDTKNPGRKHPSAPKHKQQKT